MKNLVEILLATFVGFSVLAITSGAKECYRGSGNCKTADDCGLALKLKWNTECGQGLVCCFRPCQQGFGVCTPSDDCNPSSVLDAWGSKCNGNEVCCKDEPKYPYLPKFPDLS